MSLGMACGVDQDRVGGTSRFAPGIYRPISCVDTSELSSLVQDWNFEFTQLSPGPLAAKGGMVALDCALIGQVTLDQTLLHRGHAPRGSAAILIPGYGPGQVFVRGRSLGSAQCVAMAEGACIEAITRDRYVGVSLAIDLDAWNTHSRWLSERTLIAIRDIEVANPGPLWIDRMLNTVEWIFNAIRRYPQATARLDVRASLRDWFLMAMADFGCMTDGAEHYSRDTRARQRIAVERAREYIRAKLAEPLRLSELCSYAHVQARSLQYGFREITGLSPLAYVKSLRLNEVRKDLSRGNSSGHSISEIALDHGFWHLSQFAADYRKFFGETPTSTRHRALAVRS